MLPDTTTQRPGTTGRLRSALQSPGTAVAATVLACFALTAAVSSLVETPRIFYDELIYMEAAASLADGEGLEVRDEPYAYGVLYPTVLAPLLALAGDRETAYALAKLLNALLFALTAVPVYLLARRLLAPWPSVGVAALSVAVPSTVYVTVVMTESLAYLTVTWALLAVVLAIERPTVLRQVAALAAVGVAILVRTQFVSFYAAFLLALVLAQWLLPERRALGWRGLRVLWPAAASVVVGLLAFVLGPLLRGSESGDALGGYGGLLRTYDLATVGKWFVQHAAGLELYLAVVPVAVSPIVLSIFFARARGGSERHAAFVAAFATFNAAALAAAAIVVTSQDDPGLEIDRLHDRYLFYVVPLWLIVLVWWIADGAPRPRTRHARGNRSRGGALPCSSRTGSSTSRTAQALQRAGHGVPCGGRRDRRLHARRSGLDARPRGAAARRVSGEARRRRRSGRSSRSSSSTRCSSGVARSTRPRGRSSPTRAWSDGGWTSVSPRAPPSPFSRASARARSSSGTATS